MDEEPHADRQSPVGEPVVRSDPAITGERADSAVEFNPADPDSVAEAATTVRRFAAGDVGDDDQVLMLRGAAAWMTGREVRSVASAVNNGTDVQQALRDVGVTLGRLSLELPVETYVELRRQAAMQNVPPGRLVASALEDAFGSSNN